MPEPKPAKANLEEEEGPENSLRKLMSTQGVQGYVILNKSGIPIKYHGMEATEALHHSALLSELTLATQLFLSASAQTIAAAASASTALATTTSASAASSTALTTFSSASASSAPFPSALASAPSSLASTFSTDLVSIRLKSRKLELIVTPEDSYTLIVLHNAGGAAAAGAGGEAAVGEKAAGEGGDKKGDGDKKPAHEEKESMD
jgi:hypothetical protein